MKTELQFRVKIHDGGVQYKLRVLGGSVWASNHFAKWGWFRLFGKGLKWKHESLGLIFSERYGYTKYIKAAGWIIGYLPSNKW